MSDIKIDNVENLNIEEPNNVSEMTDGFNSKDDTNGDKVVLYDGDGFCIWKEKMTEEVFLDIELTKLKMSDKCRAFRHKVMMSDKQVSVMLPEPLKGLSDILGV